MNKSVNFLLFVFLLFNTALKFPLFHYSSREKKLFRWTKTDYSGQKKLCYPFVALVVCNHLTRSWRQ